MARPLHIRRFLCALAAALLALAATAAQASAAPKIKRAAAVDADDDGRVDAFDVTFSAKLPKAKGKARVTVSGFRVTGIGSLKGKRVRARVAEGAACDLGAKPRIAFRRGGHRSRIDLGRKDRRAPRLTCAATRDGVADGLNER